MRNRLIYAALGIVGVLLIGLAIASATVWRADSVLHASATADQAIVVTDPGVLEMAGDPVTVTATVPTGDRVVLAIGRDTDVTGWVGTADHQRVAGLAGWHALALAAPTAPTGATGTATPTPTASGSAAPAAQSSPTTSPAAAPAGTSAVGAVPDATASDMWVATSHGTGSASLTWQARPGRWSLLVVGSTTAGVGAPPTVSLQWPRSVTTPYLAPGAVVGGLLLLVALFLFWRDLRRRHEAAWTPVATGAIPIVTAGEGAMTRRQLREMAELARTGQLPTVVLPPGPAAPPAARPTPWVPGPVGGPDGTRTATGAGHDEPAAPRPAYPTASGAAATGAGPGAVPSATSTGAARSDAPLRAAGPAARPTAPATASPSQDAGTPPAGGTPKGRWRRTAEPAPQPAAEPAIAPAPASSTWAPQEGSASTAPVPVVASPAKPPAPGGRRARRQAAAAAAGTGAPQGTTAPADATPPSAPDRPAAKPAATEPLAAPPATTPDGPVVPAAQKSHPHPSRPAWMPTVAPAAPGATPPAPAAGTESASAAHRAGTPAPSSAHAPGAQPAWLSRVAARWEQEDAAAEAEEAAAGREAENAQASPPSSPAPAPSPSVTSEPQVTPTPPHGEPQQAAEPSRADAWRRAWGLPPLETEEKDR